MLTVGAVLAEYESLYGNVIPHTRGDERGALPLDKHPKMCYVPNNRGVTGPSHVVRGWHRPHFHLGPAGASEVCYQYVTLSGAAPEVGAASLEGLAASASVGGAPGIWGWLCGVAVCLEVVNDDLYHGQYQQRDLMVVQVAELRTAREQAAVQLSRFRSLARRSHQPRVYSDRINAMAQARDNATSLSEKLVRRADYDRELIILTDGLEQKRIRPLVI